MRLGPNQRQGPRCEAFIPLGQREITVKAKVSAKTVEPVFVRHAGGPGAGRGGRNAAADLAAGWQEPGRCGWPGYHELRPLLAVDAATVAAGAHRGGVHVVLAGAGRECRLHDGPEWRDRRDRVPRRFVGGVTSNVILYIHRYGVGASGEVGSVVILADRGLWDGQVYCPVPNLYGALHWMLSTESWGAPALTRPSAIKKPRI